MRAKAHRQLPSSAAARRVGRSAAFRALVDVLDRVAAGDAWVLLIGERGSGRSLAARRVHSRSTRSRGPLIELDAIALLQDADPVGGAREAAAAARDGSLVIRDAASLPASCVQALRDAGARALLLLGPGDAPWPARPAGAVTVHLPPLRDRRADIPILAAALLAEHGQAAPQIAADALERLTTYDWPGNVSELAAVLSLLVHRRPGETVRESDLDQPLLPPSPATRLADVERRHILAVLAACGGNRSLAASALGISPRTLYNRMRRYHGDPPAAPPAADATGVD